MCPHSRQGRFGLRRARRRIVVLGSLLAAVIAFAAPAAAQGAPTSAATSPAFTNSASITVGYTATDDSGAGLTKVELWVQRPGDTAHALAMCVGQPTEPPPCVAPSSGSLTSGSFDYVAVAGDGTYSFYTKAYNAGGEEADPAGDATATLLDRGQPTSIAIAPDTSASRSFTVSYEASDPEVRPGEQGSGLSDIELWVKAPGETDYALAGPPQGNPSPTGSFNYTAPSDGTYSFYSVARDRAGMVQDPPGPATSTLVNSSTPPPPTGSPGPAAAPPAATRSVGPARRPPASFVLISGRTMRLSRNRSILVRLNCAGTRDCAGTLELVTAEPIRVSRRRSRKRVVKLASKSFAIPAAKTTSVRVRLSKGKARLVKRLRRVKTMVVIRDRDSAGRARTSTRVITLRAR